VGALHLLEGVVGISEVKEYSGRRARSRSPSTGASVCVGGCTLTTYGYDPATGMQEPKRPTLLQIRAAVERENDPLARVKFSFFCVHGRPLHRVAKACRDGRCKNEQ